MLLLIGPPINLDTSEDPHPSLSDFHDYEPNLEFDDTELSQAPPPEDDLVATFDEDSFASGESTDTECTASTLACILSIIKKFYCYNNALL